jgi:hypothetical protein
MCKAQKLAIEGAGKATAGDISAITESIKPASEASIIKKGFWFQPKKQRNYILFQKSGPWI